jgi:hypothetical protein
MTATRRTRESSGDDGGIYREQGPRGGLHDNYATEADDRRMPPTQSPGSVWRRVQRTPDSNR